MYCSIVVVTMYVLRVVVIAVWCQSCACIKILSVFLDDLAGISNNSESELHIYEFTIQPFHAAENNTPTVGT